MAVEFNATGEALSRTTSLLNHNSPYTHMGWYFINSGSTGGCFFCSLVDSASNNYDFVGLNSATEWYIEVANSVANTLLTPAWSSSDSWVHIAAVRASNTSYIVYLNGVAVGTNTFDITGRSTADAVRVGRFSTAFANQMLGRVAHIKQWSVALSVAEVHAEIQTIPPRLQTNLYGWYPVFPGATERLADYSGNGRNWTADGTLSDVDGPPVSWGAPVIIVQKVAGAALTHYTLTADSGTFTLTGTAAGLAAGRRLLAAGTSYALTGTAASLERGYKLTAASAAFVLTGTAANLAAGRRLLAAVGTFDLTGNDASLRRAAYSQQLAASFVLTGTDAALNYAGLTHYSITAQSGVFALTGIAATLAVGCRLLAAGGTFALTGIDASFTLSRLLTAASGTYTLTGIAADLIWSAYEIPPTPAERIYTVAYEDRTYVIDAEDRTYTVAAESRTLELA